MNRRFFHILLIAVLIGIQPAFAQEDESAASTGETVIDLGTATDEDFQQLLEAQDIDITNKDEEQPFEDPPAAMGENTSNEEASEEPVLAEETPADTEESAIAEETPAGADTEEPAIAEETPVDVDTEEPALAEETPAEEEPPFYVTEKAPSYEDIPYRIRNNRYFLESQRLANLAERTYNFGDYDASAGFAEEAIRYAQLSDEYVALQMRVKAANDAIAAAKFRIDWAVSSGASKQYPAEFNEAETWYKEAISARAAEEWDSAIDAAHRVVELLAYIEAPEGTLPLPATYTVRAWTTFKDCLWNIAGRSWVYGNPHQWRVLYNANKSKLPDPNNPNLIEPGMVLDIPSIKGETRRGAWDGSRTYNPLR